MNLTFTFWLTLFCLDPETRQRRLDTSESACSDWTRFFYEEVFVHRSALSVVPFILMSLSASATPTPPAPPASSASSEPYQIEVRPVGPTEAQTGEWVEKLLTRPEVQKELEGHRYRVLATDFDEHPEKEGDEGNLSSDFRLQVYDYTTDRLFTVRAKPGRDLISPAQPHELDIASSPDEFDEAVKIVSRDPRYAAAISMGLLLPYEAMPPIVAPSSIGSAGNERVIPIGLLPISSAQKHEIVAVDLSRESVHSFSTGAPPTAIATTRICEPPSAGQGSTGRGLSGSAEITVRRGNDVLWQFTVVRPSSSSGSKGSGIDVRKVSYRGHRVLAKMHTPILNVRYASNRCGPYRDWAYAENPFRASGTSLAPGILKASTQPSTIIDSGHDSGNYRGVAVYDAGDHLVLMSELSAGWYRYVSEYSFYDDGTIQPRFKLGAVSSSCVCYDHTHHVYWRFDFDMDGARDNTIETFNGSQWITSVSEQMQKRDSSHKQWRVTDPTSGYAYTVTPGAADGTADSYGVGDVWLLRYKNTEVDDARVRTSTRAGLNAFVSGESIQDQDIVMWYAGHFRHVHDELSPLGPDAVLGPTLKLAAPGVNAR